MNKKREVRESELVFISTLSHKCAAGHDPTVIAWCLCQTEFKAGDRVRVTVQRLPKGKGKRS